jgi:glutamyl-tRNA reductase
MHILVSGLSHKTAPVEIREALAFPEHTLGEALTDLTSFPHINEAIILSTCNRTEVYTVGSDLDCSQQDVVTFLNSCHDLKHCNTEDYLYFHDSLGAVNHLFRVVSSLDSMIVGEAQILGQAKAAYSHAFEVQTTNLVLNRLFRQAFAVGKRVRTETDIGENAVSISYAAVQLAKKVFSDLAGKSVMLIGAGKMSELTAKHLLSNGVKDVIITNRSYDNAVAMAKTFKGRAVEFDALIDEMAKADIVISSTGAPHSILEKEDMKKVMAKRRYRPIFLIDIAVPRDIDADVNDVENVYLYDIDDLQSVVDSNLEERAREAKEAENIIKQEVQEFLAWLSSLEVIPTIADLRRQADRIRQAELERIGSKLEGLSAEELNAVNTLANGIINKLLHEPMVRLKQSAGQKEGYLYVDSLRHLFALDDNEEKKTTTNQKASGQVKNMSPVKNEYGTGR